MSDRRKTARRASGRALRNKHESDDCNTATSRKQHMAVINNKEISPTVETKLGLV